MQQVPAAVASEIEHRYQAKPLPSTTVRDTVRRILRQTTVINAQASLLNGVSPNGHSMMDRGDLAKIVRKAADEARMPIPESVNNAQLARIITQEQRRAGLPITRDGRIAIQIAHNG